MPRLLLVAYLFLILFSELSGQVYHFETGKILSISEADQIIWKSGVFNNYPADYGTLVVKENRKSRKSSLINIPVIRIKALNTDSALNPIFLLYGGPGESNLKPQLLFDELARNHDIVLIGYRGVDGSVKLDCPCLKNALLSESINLQNSEKLFQLAIDSCLTSFKQKTIDVRGYSMNEVVEDIEITRKLLDYEKIDFLAFSYGTMLSQIYCELYPQNIHKMAIIGARPLSKFLFDGNAYNNQIYSLYNKFLNNDSTSFKTMPVVLNEIEDLLLAIMEDDKELNPYRFLLFGFSKIYSIVDVEKIFSAYMNASNGNYSDLNILYHEFYRTFPGDVVLGDIILKKQGRVDFTSAAANTSIGFQITEQVNALYSPHIEMLESTQSSNTSTCSNDSLKVLFISGEFDVASPPVYLNDSTYFKYPNSNSVIIPNSGHLDMFNSKSSEVKGEVIEFFKK